MRRNGWFFSAAALILLFFGTTAASVAVETGEAAGELIVRTPEISKVLQHHAELAESTRMIFLVLTLIFTAILLLPRILRKDLKPWIAGSLQGILWVLYLAGRLVLVNTAHQGGTLVHGLGVHAMTGPASGQ